MADLEGELGDPGRAVDFEQTALRYAYLTGDPESCSGSHYKLTTTWGLPAAPPCWPCPTCWPAP